MLSWRLLTANSGHSRYVMLAKVKNKDTASVVSVHTGDYNHHGNLNSIHYIRLIRKMVELRKLVLSSDQLLGARKS